MFKTQKLFVKYTKPFVTSLEQNVKQKNITKKDISELLQIENGRNNTLYNWLNLFDKPKQSNNTKKTDFSNIKNL